MTTFFELERPLGSLRVTARSPEGPHADSTATLVSRSRGARWRWLPGDIAAAVLGVAAAAWVPGAPTPVALTALVVSVTWTALLLGAHAYDLPMAHGSPGHARRVLRAGATLALVVLVLATLGVAELRAPQVLALVGTASVISATQRLRVVGRVVSVRSPVPAPCRVVVAGHRRSVAAVVDELSRSRGYTVVGVCLPATAPATAFDVPVVRGFDRLRAAVAAHRADAVIVVPCSHFGPDGLRRLGWDLETAGTQLFVAPGLLDVGATRATVRHAGALPLLHVRHADLRGARRWVKEGWERVAAALALVALSPLLLVLALGVRLDSPGSPVFRQVRIGKDGRAFVMFKLRTMTLDAEQRLESLLALDQGDGVLFKLREDPRVTRVGRLLRRFSLDELPQLLNVVLGDMALVGPRPPLPVEVAAYEDDTRRRLAVKPGITGLWQVSGRSDLTRTEAVRLDLRYVDNWSITLDLLILSRTAHAVLSRRGAY